METPGRTIRSQEMAPALARVVAPWHIVATLAIALAMNLSADIRVAPAADKGAAPVVCDFKEDAVGSLPKGWRIDATSPTSALAEWKVAEAASLKDSVSAKALTITKINDTSNGVYNLCFSPVADFKDGRIEVKIKAITGKQDQGGGLMWRAKDAKNYYVARYNPLEKNLRLYYVKDGARKMLTDVKDLEIGAGQWFTMTIEHAGDSIKCSLDGKELISTTDATFPEAGSVGLWTKADAASAFTGLKVERKQSPK